MTSAIDNRTTELLKDYAFALRRLEYDVDKPGSNMTLGEYEAEEKRVTDEYAQALAATLGSETCEVVGSYYYDDYDQYEFEFSCGHSVNMYDKEPPNYCPSCGKAVKR